MKRFLVYIITGMVFGITMFKSEAASWFRIYEMFQFKSFHMYGIIGTAVIAGIIMVQIIKRKGVRSFKGEKITFNPKQMSIARYLLGGILFGLGWAITGACPGPMFTLLGAGFLPVIVVILGAIAGTYFYGLLRDKLPH
ncbi:DUF6691 family protein [Robertkochia solimangrovi]|uniref:DUF6691 family protein n=1 Tax=Robertkochia solimangrovi TaxID=2213046 RepID=UPI00117D7DCE|nr:DUF6691 family protein [Robertkochia solimangrovi]TRZ43488.1 YeeE/YedE family protein [Robertkochia solimangrovi]